jgi:hypothetical protein
VDPRLDEANARDPRLDDLEREVALLRATVSALRATRRHTPRAAVQRSGLRARWVVIGCVIAVGALAATRWVAAHCM